MNPVEHFRQAMEREGLAPPSHLPPGVLIRFHGIGETNGSKSGWAKLFEDEQAGVFGCWKTGLSQTWHMQHDCIRTAKEQAEDRQRVNEAQRIRQEEQSKQYIAAAERARQIWDGAKPAPENHPYLQRKKIQPHGLRVDQQNNLLIPVMIGGTLSSLQFIDRDGDKKFLPGGKTKGGHFTLGDPTQASTLLLCEGFATGASLHEATGHPVVLNFTANNLLPVALELRANYPDTTIAICGDDDVRTDGSVNTGRAEATDAANVIKGLLCMPALDGKKCDWNDVHVQRGLDAVRVALSACGIAGLDPPDELEVTEATGLYCVRSPKHAVSITFERLTDARDSVYAEIAIVIGTTEILSGSKLGLQSDAGQSKLSGSLKIISATIPWKHLLQKACSLVLRRHRTGEPIALLQPSASALVPYLINPIVHRGHQTLIYAPGGTCKSYLALYFALLACHGVSESGVSALNVRVLYLDWELNAETLGGRLKALQAGHPSLVHHVPFYRRCELPLHQEAHTIAAFVKEHDVQLVIVDSAAMAVGGELSSPDAAITLQRALRKINCASIVLAHVSKSVQEGQERTAFGTVFFRELARNVWELSKSDEEHPVQLVLSHTKHNFSAKHPPLGFRITFAAELVRVQHEDVGSVPAFQPKLPVPARIRNLLEDGRPRTAKSISEDLAVLLGTVKSALSRGKGTKWQQIGDDYHDPTYTVLRAK
jgi:phage/plasmid primase-like uncharacterized protein